MPNSSAFAIVRRRLLYVCDFVGHLNKADAYIAQKQWDKAFLTLVSLPLMA